MTENSWYTLDLKKERYRQAILDMESSMKGEDPLLAERLVNYPEIQQFWDSLFTLLIENEGNIPEWHSSYFGDVPNVIFGLGMHCLHKDRLVETVSESQRSKIVGRIVKHAKLLSRAMKELDLPESVPFYFHRDSCISLITEVFNEIGVHKGGGPHELSTALRSFKFNPDVGDDMFTKHTHELHSALLYLLDRWEDPVNTSALEIRELLGTLSDENRLLRMLPDVEVQRKTPKSERRLLTIRHFAKFLHSQLNIDPRQHLKTITTLAKAILDDRDGIDEATVKDALRGVEFAIPIQRE